MPALQIENLCKTYGDRTRALQGVSLTVAAGEFFGLLGPNGAGKTTLIGILCGLVRPGSGRVQVFDADLATQSARARSYLGVVPQEFNFSIFEQVQQIVVNQAGYYGIPRKEALERSATYLQQLGLWDKRKTQARHLSGGMKRRLMIARALVHQPRILILDEPTAGVDIELRRSMWDFLIKLNQSGTTIILTTHYLEEAEQLCRQLAIIDQGQLIHQGAVKSMLAMLDVESFVLDLGVMPARLPSLPGFVVRQAGESSLEVDLPREQSINELMRQLDAAGIVVQSMRNRSNRLEELFLRLTAGANGAPLVPADSGALS
ncbi:MAG: ABC transporter ATP-binding protein [Leptospiraceae bacterium]|nr:ABC transporter ATP-binding protein [Leptospiraceae bacterium]